MIAVNIRLCEHCGACTSVCATKSVYVDTKADELILRLNTKTCTKCGTCIRVCPVRALTKSGNKNN
jgi:ferredoxin